MRSILENRNQEMLRDVEILIRLLHEAEPPIELKAYKKRLIQNCAALQQIVMNKLVYLGLSDHVDVLEDVLSSTRQIAQLVRLLSSMLVTPVLRASQSDRLSLRLIRWLHEVHPETVDYPPAFSSGNWGIWPFHGIPAYRFAPIYFIPHVEQEGLLYQPLLFHEFGHELYVCHKPEMDDLVEELQEKIINILASASQRNDRFEEVQAVERQNIAYVWYRWAQELFCDAVGFAIGGPCFLHAFSSYLKMIRRSDFYNTKEDLAKSTHPVTWLRVKFLTKRASTQGFADLAMGIDQRWRTLAEAMDIVEDYHGYYDNVFEGAVTQTVEDMLTEAAPRKYSDAETTGGDWLTVASPIQLLNWAWHVYTVRPGEYSDWERAKTELFLQSENSTYTDN